MGKVETSTASIGIKIKLRDLISQINETNYEQITYMLHNGIIEDENELDNEQYIQMTDNLPIEYKEYVETNFTGLLDTYLLVPIKQILSTARWGYDRQGTNCNSRPLDFDLSVNIDEYKELEKYSIVFILQQHSG